LSFFPQIADKNKFKAIVKACVLEASIAIHSVVIGISFGSLRNNEITTIKVLMIAISFHQLFEGIKI
jgi:hypothetical protein